MSPLLTECDVCGNVRIGATITDVHDWVKEYAIIVTPLETIAVFASMVTSMLNVGENTGQLT